ncbi:COG2605 Predicted kinase related to galactokinase and mevalonate kinase [Candidatus Nanopelagicaceae bacterium]
MIIARSPLRISLGGGGTDVPSYYEEHEGFLLAAAIDRYVYVTVMRPFTEGIFLKYSEIEHINKVTEVKHPIIREVLAELNLKTPQIEITTLADIPSGTGLGSSGSFTTALIKALFAHYRKNIHPEQLADLACRIEIEKLGEPIGKQDQYIAAYGGITEFNFHKDGSVSSSPLNLSVPTVHDLEDNLLLFFTGISRSAGSILKDQVDKSKRSDAKMVENLHFTKDLGLRSKKALLQGNTKEFGELMHEHWEHKKSRSSGMTSDFIDNAYTQAIQSGAVGGKLVGAGGGGFLMFYANDKEKLRNTMLELGLEEVRFQFDFEGTKVIL